MNHQHVIELSRPINAVSMDHLRFALTGEGDARLKPALTYDEAIWMILSLNSRADYNGTQIIIPYHDMRDWLDAARYPLNRLFGRLTVLTVAHRPTFEITLDDLLEQGDTISEGDIVFLRLQFARRGSGDNADDGCRINPEAIDWLIGKKIACIGFDRPLCNSQMDPAAAGLDKFFKANIPIVTGLTNLELVNGEDYSALVVPMAVNKLEICPARAIAMKNGR